MPRLCPPVGGEAVTRRPDAITQATELRRPKHARREAVIALPRVRRM